MINNNLKKYLNAAIDTDIKLQYAQELQNIVPFDGWQTSALTSASTILGLDPQYHRLVFVGGIDESVSFYEQYANAKMLVALESIAHANTTDKIEAALNLRIFTTGGSKLMARKTAAYYSRPQHATLALKAAWQTADSIWYATGDSSTDYNYYTKRSLLSSIYLASLVYYLNDESADQQATKNFITKALAKTVQFAKLTKKIKAAIPSITDLPIVRMFF